MTDLVTWRRASPDVGARIPVWDTEARLRAAIATAAAGDLIDLGGLKEALTSKLVIPAGVIVKSAQLAAGAHTAVELGAGARLVQSRVTRDSTGGVTSADRSCVVLGVRAQLLDVDVEGASLANVYAGAGVNDWTVRGGTFLNTSRMQNACAVMHGAGAAQSEGAHVEGIKTHASYTAPDGIILFNSSYARVRSNRVAGLRILPQRTLTGWTVYAGNVYRTLDRTDGVTRVVKDNGTQRNETANADPTAPSANEFGASGGYIYLNLGGVDPNTRTITSDIIGGYAYTIYGTNTSGQTPVLKGNLVSGNYATDCDGFGVYFQYGVATTEGNKSEKNYLQSCSLAGLQHGGLPHAAIGINGGSGTLLEGDTCEGSGLYGVWASNSGTGVAADVTATGSAESGFRAQTGGWQYDECRAIANTKHGFTCSTGAGDSFADLQYDGCRASGNGLMGLLADNTAGTALALSVIGGHYVSNTQDGIKLLKCRDSIVDGPIAYSNGAGNWQINISDTGSARIRVANYVIRAGANGLVVAGGTDISVGRGLNAATSTKYQIAGAVRVEQDPLTPQTLATDVPFTLTPFSSPYLTKHTGTLTANRVVTLATTNASVGQRFKIVRTGAGAFTLDVGGLKSLATNTWAEVEHDGTAWMLAGYGTL